MTTDQNLKCPHCERDGFISNQSLLVHTLRAHRLYPDGRKYTKRKTDPRRYRTMLCDICEAGPFRTKAALGAHKQKKHGVAGIGHDAATKIRNGTHWSLNGHHKAKFKKGKRAVPAVAPQDRYQPDEKPVPGCAYCPACGLHLAMFHRALEIAANANG